MNYKKDVEKMQTEINKTIKLLYSLNDMGTQRTYGTQARNLTKKLNSTINEFKNRTKIWDEEYKKSISSAISKKARISGDYSPSGSRLKELLQQKAEYEKQLNDGAEYIQATESGIVSYRVDGLEETLTPTNFATLNKAFLEKLTIKTGQTIASSEEIGKIINNFQYLIFQYKKCLNNQRSVCGLAK